MHRSPPLDRKRKGGGGGRLSVAAGKQCRRCRPDFLDSSNSSLLLHVVTIASEQEMGGAPQWWIGFFLFFLFSLLWNGSQHIHSAQSKNRRMSVWSLRKRETLFSLMFTRPIHTTVLHWSRMPALHTHCGVSSLDSSPFSSDYLTHTHTIIALLCARALLCVCVCVYKYLSSTLRIESIIDNRLLRFLLTLSHSSSCGTRRRHPPFRSALWIEKGSVDDSIVWSRSRV